MTSEAGATRISNLALPAARLWAAARFPYLASALFGCRVVEAAGIGTVAVDQAWRLWLDPEIAQDWTPAELGSLLVHHVCHLLRDHAERALGAGVGSAESESWVRCADAEINDDLIPSGLALPGEPVLPDQLGAEPGGLAEQYYQLTLESVARPGEPRGDLAPGTTLNREDDTPALPGGLVLVEGAPGGEPETASPGQPGAGSPGATQPSWTVDCGSGADGQDRPWERSAAAEGTPGLSEWEAELLARQVATEC
ncbi:MAG: DUF2201 family putative metallopeptidase, partial [Candidatus Dormibacteria bacterium]